MERKNWEVTIAYAIRLVKWNCLLNQTRDGHMSIKNRQ